MQSSVTTPVLNLLLCTILKKMLEVSFQKVNITEYYVEGFFCLRPHFSKLPRAVVLTSITGLFPHTPNRDSSAL